MLDGMARNYFLFSTWIHNLLGLDPFYSYLLIHEERRKTFGLSWNRTQFLLLHKRPLYPLDNVSSSWKSLVTLLSCLDSSPLGHPINEEETAFNYNLLKTLLCCPNLTKCPLQHRPGVLAESPFY